MVTLGLLWASNTLLYSLFVGLHVILGGQIACGAVDVELGLVRNLIGTGTVDVGLSVDLEFVVFVHIVVICVVTAGDLGLLVACGDGESCNNSSSPFLDLLGTGIWVIQLSRFIDELVGLYI